MKNLKNLGKALNKNQQKFIIGGVASECDEEEGEEGVIVHCGSNDVYAPYCHASFCGIGSNDFRGCSY